MTRNQFHNLKRGGFVPSFSRSSPRCQAVVRCWGIRWLRLRQVGGHPEAGDFKHRSKHWSRQDRQSWVRGCRGREESPCQAKGPRAREEARSGGRKAGEESGTYITKGLCARLRRQGVPKGRLEEAWRQGRPSFRYIRWVGTWRTG